MTITTYEQQFQDILEGKINSAPYDDEFYLNYVKLNSSRYKRWYKIGKLLPELQQTIQDLSEPLEWLLITEPWCGDAAHAHPFIAKLASLNPLITLTVQNRDAADSEINKYLTNRGKSIPKLVVRDAKRKDLFTWGPRPKSAHEIHLSNLNNEHKSAEEKKVALQNWYNKDKGISFQEELLNLLQKNVFLS